ncbi:hypothetical protein [Senegalia massiliensis]|uniref:hypothetical protein n=1 Tax=Senegalia massiliensis TaxID=1720316 RepID=UPI00103108AE|nr:hypothetical protein [Senegalia massiliensis]
MKINQFLIQLSYIMIIIFGGVFTIRYFRMDELLLDQLIGVFIGAILLIVSLLWKRKHIL